MFVEQGFGPKNVEEFQDPALASYNGRDGGKMWAWYTRSVFEQELAMRGVDLDSCTERQCEEALCATSAKFKRGLGGLMGLYPYAGPQCYPQLKDLVRLNANSGDAVERRVEERGRKGRGTDASVALPEQCSECWLRCEKCNALRLVESGCLASLISKEFEYTAPGERIDWREWLAAAPNRYEAWSEGALPREDGAVEVIEAVDETAEAAAVSDGELPDAVGVRAVRGEQGEMAVDEHGAGDDEQCSWGAVLRGVGSRQRRQADGGVLSTGEKAEQRRLAGAGGRTGAAVWAASGAKLRFECSMLITEEDVSLRGPAEEEDDAPMATETHARPTSRWRPVRCWSQEASRRCGELLQQQANGVVLNDAEQCELASLDAEVGDLDDYAALKARRWVAADFEAGDHVVVLRAGASTAEPLDAGWYARTGAVLAVRHKVSGPGKTASGGREADAELEADAAQSGGARSRDVLVLRLYRHPDHKKGWDRVPELHVAYSGSGKRVEDRRGFAHA